MSISAHFQRVISKREEMERYRQFFSRIQLLGFTQYSREVR